jgi:pSer/pThr/pTyr-binding forkhead associated (FHA) protein
MRIEILVENQEPLIFPLNKPKVIIGSHESCDVVLKTYGISRRHVEVISENDLYYIIDQESLNGTWINDKKVIPGKRQEFTSFFPVRLGDNVLLTLISDAEAEVFGASETLDDIIKKVVETPLAPEDRTDTTRQISFNDLYSAKTEKLVKKRTTVVDKKKIQNEQKTKLKKRDERRMGVTKFLAVLVGAGALYYNFIYDKPLPPVVPEEKVSKVGEQVVIDPQTVPAVPKVLLPEETELTKREKFATFLTEIKCVSDLEKYLCGLYPETAQEGYGAYQVGTMINVVVDGTSSFDKARVLVQPRHAEEVAALTPEQREIYDKNLRYAAMVYFINERIPATLNYTLLQNSKVTFALSLPKLDGSRELVVAAFVPESLQKLKNLMEPRYFENAYKYGMSEIEFFKEYFRYY